MTREELFEVRLAKNKAKLQRDAERTAEKQRKVNSEKQRRRRNQVTKDITPALWDDWRKFMETPELHDKVERKFAYNIVRQGHEEQDCHIYSPPDRIKKDGTTALRGDLPLNKRYISIRVPRPHWRFKDKKKGELEINPRNYLKLCVLRVAVWVLKRRQYHPETGPRLYHTCGNPLCVNPRHFDVVSRELYNQWVAEKRTEPFPVRGSKYESSVL